MGLSEKLELCPVGRSVRRLQELGASAQARCHNQGSSPGERSQGRSRSWSPRRQVRGTPWRSFECPDGASDCKKQGGASVEQEPLFEDLKDTVLPEILEKAAAAAAEDLECSVSGACSCAQLALFKGRLREGHLHASLASLVEVELSVGTSLHAAVSLVRDGWKAGGIRLHGFAPEALQKDVFGCGQAPEAVVQAVLALEEAHASAALKRVSWAALRAMLLCFRRQRLRPTLGLLREMCRAVFGLEASDEDLVAAASAGPPGACWVDYAPWPLPGAPVARDEEDVGDAAILQLESCEPDDSMCIFPPYCAEFQSVVEADVQNAGLKTLEAMQSMAVPTLTLHNILLMAAVDSSETFSAGALLWLWEKARAPPVTPAPLATAPAQQVRRECRRSLYNSDTSTAGSCAGAFVSELSEQSSPPDPNEDLLEVSPKQMKLTSPLPRPAPGLLLPAPGLTRPAFFDTMCTSEQDNFKDAFSDDDQADAGDSEDTHLHPTPHEAFAACFGQELLRGRQVALSQINNLYRMRSGGFSLRYRNYGYVRMCDFLAEVPGVEFVGIGNKMSVKASNTSELAEICRRLTQNMARKAAELRGAGEDASALEVVYRQPKAVPEKILARIWDIFQEAPEHEMQVSAFVSLYKERYRSEKTRLASLGFQEVRGLMAYVPFIEKVGSRGHAKYILKPDSQPPELCKDKGRQNRRPTGRATPLTSVGA